MDMRDFTRGRLRGHLIGVFADSPETEIHTRELVRRTGRSPRAVHVALEQLQEQGFLRSRRLGGLRLWSIEPRNPLLRPIQEMAKRTVGVPARLRRALDGVRGIQISFIFGSYASGTEDVSSDLDLFVLGNPDWRGLAQVLSELKVEFGREVNMVAWTPDQLVASQRNPFYMSLVNQPKIWLVGKEGDLEEQARHLAREVRRSHPNRSGR